MSEDISVFNEKLKIFRQSRRNRTQKMPIELKREAVSLLKKHGYSRMNSFCPIGNSTLYKWKSQIDVDSFKKSKNAAQTIPNEAKKGPEKYLSHTRINSSHEVEAKKPERVSGCFFEIGNIQFCINDPAFLAQAIQLLQPGTEECL